MKVHWERAHRNSTTHYKAERDKVRGISGKKSLVLVKKLHGIIIPARTIQHTVSEVTVGMLPRKGGNRGSIPDLNLIHLKIYFDIYIKIKQINGKEIECDHKHLQANIKKCKEGCKFGPIN